MRIEQLTIDEIEDKRANAPIDFEVDITDKKKGVGMAHGEFHLPEDQQEAVQKLVTNFLSAVKRNA